MSVILTAVATLGAIGAGSAGILYLVSQKFKVEEDLCIQEVQDTLPAANCGGCGFPGCAGSLLPPPGMPTLWRVNCPVGERSPWIGWQPFWVRPQPRRQR